MATVRQGVFTPWASILCWECHGPKFHGSEERPVKDYEAKLAPVECDKRHGTCDKCKRPIDTGRDDVNILAALRDRLNAHHGRQVAGLVQSGGMCVLLEVPLADAPARLWVTDGEQSDDDLSVYRIAKDYPEDAEDEEPVASNITSDEAFDRINAQAIAQAS